MSTELLCADEMLDMTRKALQSYAKRDSVEANIGYEGIIEKQEEMFEPWKKEKYVMGMYPGLFTKRRRDEDGSPQPQPAKRRHLTADMSSAEEAALDKLVFPPVEIAKGRASNVRFTDYRVIATITKWLTSKGLPGKWRRSDAPCGRRSPLLEERVFYPPPKGYVPPVFTSSAQDSELLVHLPILKPMPRPSFKDVREILQVLGFTVSPDMNQNTECTAFEDSVRWVEDFLSETDKETVCSMWIRICTEAR